MEDIVITESGLAYVVLDCEMEDCDFVEMFIDCPISGFVHPCPVCVFGTVEYRGSRLHDDTHYMYPWKCRDCETYWRTGDLIDAASFQEIEQPDSLTESTVESISIASDSHMNIEE